MLIVGSASDKQPRGDELLLEPASCIEESLRCYLAQNRMTVRWVKCERGERVRQVRFRVPASKSEIYEMMRGDLLEEASPIRCNAIGRVCPVAICHDCQRRSIIFWIDEPKANEV